MIRRSFACVVTCLAVLLVCNLSLVRAGDEPKKDMKSGEQKGQMSDEMAAMMKYAEPDEHHDMLKPLAGKWTFTIRHRMDKDSPWNEATGTSVNEWILGGRYLRQQVESPYEEEGTAGGVFRGLGFYGYDRQHQKFISLWMDNMGTRWVTADGKCDPSGKVFTFQGEFEDATGNVKKYRSVMRIIGDDQYGSEEYLVGPGGEETKVMEIKYSRS
jgi:hypothetical protein